jgi:uncharacterized glyoxalase superfamily protein PhnB
MQEPLSNRSMPPGRIIPVLSYGDVAHAVDWLCSAFGFEERLRISDHRSQLVFGGGSVVVAAGGDAPSGHSVMVRVDDVDAMHARALSHGATVIERPTDHVYGERQCSVVDVGGHTWTFSQTIADSDPADWGGKLV